EPSPRPVERPGESDGTATIARYTPDEVIVDVDTPTPGILILTDQDYPGWEAYVDGRPTEILTSDYVFRGVPLAGGIHRIVLRFVPRAFRRGLWVAAGGSVLALGAMLVTRRRDAGARPDSRAASIASR